MAGDASTLADQGPVNCKLCGLRWTPDEDHANCPACELRGQVEKLELMNERLTHQLATAWDRLRGYGL